MMVKAKTNWRFAPAILLLFFLKFSAVSAAGTLTLQMDTVSGTPGQHVTVDIKVKNFNALISAQGTVIFDTSELRFVKVASYGLASLNSSNFGTTGAAQGNITFSWNDQTFLGVTIPDDSDFFSLQFTLSASACLGTALHFSSSPATMEFIDTNFNTISFVQRDGMVIPSPPSTLTPGITISGNTTICSGSAVTFTSAISNGGSTPHFQWKVNGSNAGTDSSSFTTSALTNGAVVTCVLTSSSPCASPTTATSNSINESVSNSLLPSVSVHASQTSICSGTVVTFTATPVNGGATPTYQWMKNGKAVGSNNVIYTDGALNNNDSVWVVMTSASSCASPGSATSNKTTLTVNAAPSSPVAGSNSPVTIGDTIKLSATMVPGAAYLWNGPNGYSSSQQNPNLTNANTGMSGTYEVVAVANGCNSKPDSVIVLVTVGPGVFTLYMDTVSGTPGQQVTINIRVKDFVEMLSTQGTIAFDTSELHFVQVTNLGLASLSTSDFGTSNSAFGYITFSWQDQTLQGTTLANDSIFFSLQFTLSANACSNSVLSFAGSPTSLEFIDISLVADTTYTLGAGMVVPSPVGTVVPSILISGSNSICSGVPVTFTAAITNGGKNPTYQWQVNGNGVGGDSSTYTTSTLNDGDGVSCVLVSSLACANPSIVISNGIVETVNTGVVPQVAVSPIQLSICAGTPETFTATAINQGPTPAYQWMKNGLNVGGNISSYSDNALNDGDIISCILTSSASCALPASVASNGDTVTVNPAVTPAIQISDNSSGTVCAGAPVTFTATALNGGATPAYQWMKNGVNVGTNSGTYNDNALNNGDIVLCELTSNAFCASPTIVASNSDTIKVIAWVTPTIQISANPNGAVCTGEQVTFNAVATNSGTSPVYGWEVNGVNAGSNQNSYSSVLNNGDVVKCLLTSNATCALPDTAVSNNINMIVSNAIVPSIAIQASQTNICTGAAVVFTAIPNGGGLNPSYQWKVNGTNAGADSSHYTTTSLTNGAVVSCVLTSSSSCASPTTATSDSITITVSTTLMPSVSISTGQTTICAGTPATFTATPTNGGGTPVYQWKKNNVNVGSNSNTYSNNALSNGDVILCVLTSSSSCASPTVATSNSDTMTVTPLVTPTIQISANPNGAVCTGTPATFAAVAIDSGTAPIYQWEVNGANAGANHGTYSATLNNGDVVKCVLISNANCASPDSAVSNSINMVVSGTITPSVSIQASLTAICASALVVFTATPNGGGASPAYQWKVNGTLAGSGTDSFATTGLNNNDVVSCFLTSSAGCANPDTASSGPISISVTPVVTPTISITASSGSICPGAADSFSASISHGGAGPIYIWNKNGTVVGGNAGNYTDASLLSTDVIKCLLISNASCVSADTVTSNALSISIKPVPDATVTPAGNVSLCAGDSIQLSAAAGIAAYAWSTQATSQNIFVKSGGTYTVTVTGANSCTASSQGVQVVVNPLPAVPVVTQSNDTLTSSVAASYQWYLNNGTLSGETGRHLVITQSGQYTVEVTDNNGCKNLSAPFHGTVGIMEVAYGYGVKLYPNPNSGEFTLEFTDNVAREIKITDAIGRELIVSPKVQMREHFNLSQLEAGIYFLRISQENKIRTLRFNVAK